jgi:hypothetical protein
MKDPTPVQFAFAALFIITAIGIWLTGMMIRLQGRFSKEAAGTVFIVALNAVAYGYLIPFIARYTRK